MICLTITESVTVRVSLVTALGNFPHLVPSLSQPHGADQTGHQSSPFPLGAARVAECEQVHVFLLEEKK